MRISTIISFLLLFINFYSIRAAENTVVVTSDSVYKVLSNDERNNLRVWVDANNNPIDAWDNYPIGGYYVRSLDQIDKINRSAVRAIAWQANFNFSPFDNGEKLPDLATLSAIENKALLNDYLDFFRSQLKTKGVDFVVLPPVDSLFFLESLFLEIKAFDPGFFLLHENLAFNPSDRRKEFYPELLTHSAIVLDPLILADYEKTMKKGPKRLDFKKADVLTYLDHLLTRDVSARNPATILHRIWTESISLFEKNPLLPLKSDTIAIWVSDENNALFRELKQYYSTVLNLKYDRIPPKIPVIIDARYNFFQASEYAYARQKSNPVIWISSDETLQNVNAAAYVLTPQINKQHDQILADMIYGGESISGKYKMPLPAFMSAYKPVSLDKQMILSYSKPEWMGMQSEFLDSIDHVIKEMIQQMAAPGCQILVARKGKVVFEKYYGYLTYDSLIEVTPHTIYDLASLTKVSATLLGVMALNESGKINLDSSISYYIEDFRETNKDSISIKSILAHNAGLPSYIPFWKRTLDIEGLETFYYKNEEALKNDQRSYGLTPHPLLKDSLVNWIKNSSVTQNPRYKYSDIGFMILQDLVERTTNLTLEDYISFRYYQPLSLRRTIFNPLQKGIDRHFIAPTEYDYYFREEQIWGEVHDRNAAILGGIGGHAGLFSNAKELAVLFQMILQNGRYGGNTYLSKETLDLYNDYYFKNNRRGLGWDKPGQREEGIRNPNISAYASEKSFGHTGFTGTLTWLDPEEELVFVFLSNRIFPDATNWRLNQLDTRRRVHDLIYKSIVSD